MSATLEFECILELSREEAVREADASWPRRDDRWAAIYETAVVRRYVDRISPIPYGIVVRLPE